MFLCSGARSIAIQQALGVGDGDDGDEFAPPADFVVNEKRPRDARRSARPAVSTRIAVEAAAALHQPGENADQVAAHGAADAAVIHLEDFFVGIDDDIVVDADFAELVDDDGEPLAVVLAEYAVEKRRLAGIEIAGQNRDWSRATGPLT